MPIGVFHEEGIYNEFYTCCCRARIGNDREHCPRCGIRVIPSRDRDEFTRGTERQARWGRIIDRYMASGKYEAGKIAARLKGEVFIPPTLCRTCGEPEPECKCVPIEWK